MLQAVGEEVGLPTVSEVMSPEDVDLVAVCGHAAIGARNMQNYALCGKWAQ